MIELVKWAIALFLFLSPFIAAAVTASLGVKLRCHMEHHKSGTCLTLLPPITFFWFVLLLFLMHMKAPIVRLLTWHVHFLPFGIFIAVETLLLRTIAIREYRIHAVLAALLCAAAAYVIFGSIFF